MSSRKARSRRADDTFADRWAAIRTTTAEALELAPAARDAYIERASAGDPELHQRVCELVRACESAGRAVEFLAQDAASFAAPMFASARRQSASMPSRAATEGATGIARSAVEATLRDALAGRYDVEREIARGGMATVYLARDVRHDRAVALKVLDPALSAAVSSERFLREIRLTAGLTHPNILPLHDSGDTASATARDALRLLYYVMPYVPGESLRQRLLRECRLGPATAVRLVREVASALAYAHRQGVVHRDIKPGNILLADEHALVADFGIARAVRRAHEAAEAAGSHHLVDAFDGSDTLTQSHASLGTPAYMAPEQITGDPTADHRVDLYALGIVAYEAFAGVHPFGPRSTHELLRAQLEEVPVSLGERCTDLPRSVSTLVMRLLAKDPAQRPRTADEVVDALDTVLFSAREHRGPALARRQPADGEGLVAPSTGDVGAYDLYLRGRYNWSSRTGEGLERAIAYFQQAIDRDPGYALAYQGMADAYMNLGNYGFLPLADALSRARVAADRAVALGPNVAETYASQGFVLASQRQFADAEAALRRSIELRPNYIWAHHYYSLLLAMIGRVDDARAENARAADLDPISPPVSAHGGIIACIAGDLREARRQLETNIALAPGFPLGLFYLGVVNAAEGKHTEAIGLLEQAHEQSPTFPGVQGALAYAYARVGRAHDAATVVDEVQSAPDSSRARLNRALFDAMRGDLDRAFDAVDDLDLDLPGLIELRADPLLADFRRDARYDRVIRRLGAE